MNPDIIPRFTANNQLVISFENLNLEHGSFKLCFSLVYSIQSLKGARILKQIGRYYELETKDNELLIDLQTPRTGSYNLSCGPEGIFIINSANDLSMALLRKKHVVSVAGDSFGANDNFRPVGKPAPPLPLNSDDLISLIIHSLPLEHIS